MVQYGVYSRKDSSNLGHIAIRSRTDLSSAWSAETTILSYNASGLDATVVQLRFAQLIKDPDATGWYLFFNSEESPLEFDIYRAHSSDADPTVAGAWGSIAKVLSKSGTGGTFDEDGVAGPFVFRLSAGDWRMIYSGYDASDYDIGSWEGGMATATSIGGTWTRHGSNPIWPKPTLETLVNGATSSRTITVDSTTGFSANQPIVIGAKVNGRYKYRPTRIRKINSSTQIEVWHKLNNADNIEVTSYEANSIYPRSIRRSLDPAYNWEMWATIFRYANGQECTGKFVGTGSDPATATWILSRDHGFPWIGLWYKAGTTPSQDWNADSCENPGFIFDKNKIMLRRSSTISAQTRTPAMARRARM